jgi:hypothetical protein
MTRIDTPLIREPVEPDDRGAMTPARKRRIWEARGGKCWMCGQAVPVEGRDVRYDHKLPLELGGSDDDANLWPLHREPCDRIKTAADRKRIDKMRRQETMQLGREKPPTRTPLRSRGFSPTRDWGRGHD